MSIRVTNLVWERSSLSGTDLLLMVAIADQANDEGEAWPALPTLTEKVRLGTVRGLQKALDRCELSGELITVNRDRTDGKKGNITNLYRVNVALLLSRPQRYYYSKAERDAAKAKARAENTHVPQDTPPNGGCPPGHEGGVPQDMRGVSPRTPETLLETSLETDKKISSANADTRPLSQSSQEGQEGAPKGQGPATVGKAAPNASQPQAVDVKRVPAGAAADAEAQAALERLCRVLCNIWNEHCGKLPRLKLKATGAPVSAARMKLLGAYVKNVGEADAASIWLDAVRQVAGDKWWLDNGYTIENLARHAESKADKWANGNAGNKNADRVRREGNDGKGWL